VVFGAIVALGIGKYEGVIRHVWELGPGATALSLFVAGSIGCFVVYDIAVYHLLVGKYPYQLSPIGFLRFYLDLVMAFILYVLLASALQVNPDWLTILVAVSLWHLAAVAWHVLARRELRATDDASKSYLMHGVFVCIYWISAFLAWTIGGGIFGLADGRWKTPALVVVSAAILIISLYRWVQVLKEFSARKA
jgi:hypothetical protein